MTLQHSRLSFGQLLRRAKRADQLRQYRRTSTERVAVIGREVVRYAARSAAPFADWERRREWDGADTSEAWSGGFAENH